MVLDTPNSESNDPKIGEKMTKRNGGNLDVTLNSVLQGVNNGTKQTCQQLAEVRKQVGQLESKVFESEKRLNVVFSQPAAPESFNFSKSSPKFDQIHQNSNSYQHSYFRRDRQPHSYEMSRFKPSHQPQNRNHPYNRFHPLRPYEDRHSITCYTCGTKGHYSRECPKKQASSRPIPDDQPPRRPHYSSLPASLAGQSTSMNSSN